MKHSFLALFLLFAAAPLFAGNRNTSRNVLPETPHAPGVVYVKMLPGSQAISNYKHVGAATQSVGRTTFSEVLDQLHASQTQPFDADAPKDDITHNLGIDRMYVIYYSNKAIDPKQALQMLLSTGEVECGSVRYIFPFDLTPNDPQIGQQYALDTMSLFSAWDITIGDSNILIADVDDGFNTTHQDLKGAIKTQWDLVGNVNAAAGEPYQPDGDATPSSERHSVAGSWY
jgi:hypothetical protein